MKTVSKPLALLIILVLALAGGACNNITIDTNQDQNHHNAPSPAPSAAPSASPSPSSSTKAATKSVTVNGFANGEKCPAGTSPAAQNGKIRLGCDLAVTCNPRDAEGKVIFDDKAPPVDYFVLASGKDVVTFSQWPSNTYNADVRTVKAGHFQLVCSVVGISSGPTDFEVIQ